MRARQNFLITLYLIFIGIFTYINWDVMILRFLFKNEEKVVSCMVDSKNDGRYSENSTTIYFAHVGYKYCHPVYVPDSKYDYYKIGNYYNVKIDEMSLLDMKGRSHHFIQIIEIFFILIPLIIFILSLLLCVIYVIYNWVETGEKL